MTVRRLADGFERLSPESRYRRFFGPVAHLSERDLDYLTRVDHHDHEALVAIEEGTGDGVGVARYVRTGPDVAEPAMVVVDDWQGRGAGTRLLDALVERAHEEGIRRFEAPVLAYNAESIHVLERLGNTIRTQHGREVELTIDLPEARGRGSHPTAAEANSRHGALAARPGPARAAVAAAAGRAGRPGAQPDRRRDGRLRARGRRVEAAAALAAAWNATVDVVGVHRFLLPAHPEVTAAVQAAAQTLRARDVPVHAHLRRGDPALVLADVAAEENARMIVVGAGEHGKLARRLIGSVADLVAERSPCNVLIVRR